MNKWHKGAREYAEEIVATPKRSERISKLNQVPDKYREEVRSLVETAFKHKRLIKSQSLSRLDN